MWCDDWLQTVHGDAAVQQFLIGRRRPSSQLSIDPPTDREFIEPTLIRDEQVDKLRHDNKAHELIETSPLIIFTQIIHSKLKHCFS